MFLNIFKLILNFDIYIYYICLLYIIFFSIFSKYTQQLKMLKTTYLIDKNIIISYLYDILSGTFKKCHNIACIFSAKPPDFESHIFWH